MNTNGVDPWLASRPALLLAEDTLHVPRGKAARTTPPPPPPMESRGCGSARVGEIYRAPYIIRTCVFHRYRKYIRARDSGSPPRHVHRGGGFSGSSPRHVPRPDIEFWKKVGVAKPVAPRWGKRWRRFWWEERFERGGPSWILLDEISWMRLLRWIRKCAVCFGSK